MDTDAVLEILKRARDLMRSTPVVQNVITRYRGFRVDGERYVPVGVGWTLNDRRVTEAEAMAARPPVAFVELQLSEDEFLRRFGPPVTPP